jgi:pyruvate,water dikinase
MVMQQPVDQAPVICIGLAIGEGLASGTARFVASPSELGALRPGEILLAEDITPEWDCGVAAVVSIITNLGDAGGHAAALARKLGVLAVVGTVDGATPLWSGATLAVSCTDGVGLVREMTWNPTVSASAKSGLAFS